jgi:hypothetical protein
MAFLSTLLLGVSGCSQVQPPEQIQVTELMNQYKPEIKTSILVESGKKTNLRDLPQQGCPTGKVFKVGGEWRNIDAIKARFPAKCWIYRGEMGGIYVISFPSKNK